MIQNVRRYQPVQPGQPAGRPEHFKNKRSTFTQKVMVFLGIRNDRLFGFAFLDGGKITGRKYKQLLVRTALPDLRAGNGGTLQGLVWQQV